MSFIIRQIKEEELPIIIEWANQENWNLGIYDYQAFKQVDKEGFYFGEIDGKPMALLVGAKYDQSFGFMGFYIVKPQYRGKGYGKKLFNFVLEQFAKRGVYNIGLESVLQQVSRYQSHNFKFSHFTERYSIFGTNVKFQSPNLKLLKNISFELIVKYDQICSSVKRNKFLQKWISLPESQSIGFIQNEQIKGYAVLRKSANGYKLGPLFADNVYIAEQLLKSVCGTVPQNKQIYIDIPQTNKNRRILIEKYKMTLVCKFARMYTKQMPKIPLDTKIFGFTSLQLG